VLAYGRLVLAVMCVVTIIIVILRPSRCGIFGTGKELGMKRLLVNGTNSECSELIATI